MYILFFWTTAIITVTLQFICQWYFAKGELKAAYPLTIMVYLCYIAMDIGMVLYDPVLAAVLIFSTANLWTLFMSAKGMKRLKKEEKDNESL